MNILVKWPTRGNSAGLKERITHWVSRQSGRHDVRYLLGIDVDDLDSSQAAVDIPFQMKADVAIDVSPSNGKIAACNSGITFPQENIPQWSPVWAWDVVILASDDFAPEVYGWDEMVARAFAWHLPALDGLIHFPDGFSAHDRFVTIPVLGVNLWRRWGYIYHPSYRSLWCDREQSEVACTLHKSVYIDLPVFQHRWRGAAHHAATDATLAYNQSYFEQDRQMYERRKLWKFDIVPPKLSILIAALDSRRATGEPLMREIYRQIWALPDPSQVELHVALDQKRRTVGAKRQMLLERARGEYICFIDDDDRIADDYVASILSALQPHTLPTNAPAPRRVVDVRPAHPTPLSGPDCVVFQGEFRQDGGPMQIFDFDLKYQVYHNPPGGPYQRTPNHLCPVRRDLALRVGFKDQNCSEDSDYSRRLRPLLRTQAVCYDSVSVKKTLYYYDFSAVNTQTQRRGATGVKI